MHNRLFRCSKCASENTSVSVSWGRFYVEDTAFESLDCTCQRCGYVWVERPSDELEDEQDAIEAELDGLPPPASTPLKVV